MNVRSFPTSLGLLFLFFSASAQSEIVCEKDNEALRAMPDIEISLSRSDGSSHVMAAKLADTNASRAAGFQRVCESTIEAMPILFVFARETIPSFHMNNVVAPIDIAFVDRRGRIESIQSMKPYSIIEINKPVYSPKKPVLYALEVHKGFFEKHNLSAKTKMSWTKKAQLAVD